MAAGSTDSPIFSEVCDHLVKETGFVPPKNSSSLVWKFFGFKHEEGVVKDHSHVSLTLLVSFSITVLLFALTTCRLFVLYGDVKQ